MTRYVDPRPNEWIKPDKAMLKIKIFPKWQGIKLRQLMTSKFFEKHKRSWKTYQVPAEVTNEDLEKCLFTTGRHFNLYQRAKRQTVVNWFSREYPAASKWDRSYFMCFEKLRLNKMFIKTVMMKFSKTLIDILITWFSNFLHGFFFYIKTWF